MSDINININMNLDGVVAFIAAFALALLLVLGILIALFDSLIRSRRKHESFSRQRLFPQVIGMVVSLFFCVMVVALLLSNHRLPAPHTLAVWFDQWLWVWLVTVLALWPVSVLAWKKWRGRLPLLTTDEHNTSSD